MHGKLGWVWSMCVESGVGVVYVLTCDCSILE